MYFKDCVAEALFNVYFYLADCISLFFYYLTTGQLYYAFRIGVEKFVLIIILFHHQFS